MGLHCHPPATYTSIQQNGHTQPCIMQFKHNTQPSKIRAPASLRLPLKKRTRYTPLPLPAASCTPSRKGTMLPYRTLPHKTVPYYRAAPPCHKGPYYRAAHPQNCANNAALHTLMRRRHATALHAPMEGRRITMCHVFKCPPQPPGQAVITTWRNRTQSSTSISPVTRVMVLATWPAHKGPNQPHPAAKPRPPPEEHKNSHGLTRRPNPTAIPGDNHVGSTQHATHHPNGTATTSTKQAVRAGTATA